jgi:hypothetical protein
MVRRWLLAATLVLVAASDTLAQRWFGLAPDTSRRVPYDGRFRLARLYYDNYPGWSFDWPDMENNFARILHALTSIPNSPDADSNIFRMDDPELMKFPIAYLSEPGFWYPTDSEAAGLRTFILKGGFLIVDDFHFENEWDVFDRAMHLVLPEAKIHRLDISHPIFNTFFRIHSLQLPYPGQLGQRGLIGEFYGIYEGNDLTQRLSVVINYNMDIGDYMEYKPGGRYPVDETNEAYKFGINYLIYGFTH